MEVANDLNEYSRGELSTVAATQLTNPSKLMFKGYKTGLTLIIPESGPFSGYIEELKVKLHETQDFFRGAKINFQIGNRLLTEAEQAELFNTVSGYGLLPQQAFSSAPPVVNSARKPVEVSEDDFLVETITVNKTVRSGQRIEFEGNLVVLGDVNPGAEIIATGDIIVLGRLRGTAHAGATGNTKAKVIAYQLEPVQLRIAGIITRAPETSRRQKRTMPEIATIRENLIVVEPVMIQK